VAANQGNDEIVSLLLSAGFRDINSPNSSGINPLSASAEKGSEKIAKVCAQCTL
jgi:ankyrin repeat protein